MGARRDDIKVEAIRPLTKQEIDERIGRLVTEVAGCGPLGESDAAGIRPSLISAAELVRRIRPFIVYN